MYSHLVRIVRTKIIEIDDIRMKIVDCEELTILF